MFAPIRIFHRGIDRFADGFSRQATGYGSDDGANGATNRAADGRSDSGTRSSCSRCSYSNPYGVGTGSAGDRIWISIFVAIVFVWSRHNEDVSLVRYAVVLRAGASCGIFYDVRNVALRSRSSQER
jgi:hypothetical protein